MKITKKRLLKLGFKEEMNSWFQIKPIDGYIICINPISSNATIRKQGHGEIERTSLNNVIWYGSIEKWFEEKTGRIITLPRPKKLSLKKAVKGLKKNLVTVDEKHSDLAQYVEAIDERLKAIEQHIGMDKAINLKETPTPEEKPIEFGCWVEVLERCAFDKGEQGTVMEKGENTALILSKKCVSLWVNLVKLKRIKSPIE